MLSWLAMLTPPAARMLEQERATDWAGGNHARWSRSAPAEIWAEYVRAIERARDRAKARQARKAA